MYDITAYLTIKNKTYYTVLTYYVDGIRKQKWVSTGFKENESKRKAEKKLIQIRDEFKNKLETITTTSTEDKKIQISFSDFMIKWLEMIKHQVEESTYTGYKRQIEGRTKKYFTEHPIMLDELKPVHILDFYNWLYSEGLKGTTVTKYHANIRKALDYAVKTDLILTNPAIKVGRPQQEQFIADFYSEDELNTLFKIVKNTQLEVIVYLTAFYGLRRSEVLGIKWSAIDFVNKTITISHKVITVTDESEENETKTKTITKSKTKNKSSYRSLPLLPIIADVLKKYKKKIQENKKMCGNSYITDYEDYICVDTMGKLFRPEYVTDHFRLLLKNNGLRHIRFHDLRHSCASLLLSKGVPMKAIQEWLGHSTYSTTANFYTHLEDNYKTESANVLASCLKVG